MHSDLLIGCGGLTSDLFDVDFLCLRMKLLGLFSSVYKCHVNRFMKNILTVSLTFCWELKSSLMPGA